MQNIGIIGCGRIAQERHIPEYFGNPDCKIAGFYDFNIDRTQELAEKYGAKAYSSIEEMLDDPQIDAVSVCTANNSHADVTIKALGKKKHVLCEKPMAMSIEECEAMINAAKENNRRLMIGQNQRFTKAHIKAKELLEKGAVGDIITFKTTFGHCGPETWSIDSKNNNWFFDSKKAGMGAIADLGIHKTDLIQFLTSSRVVETTAKVVTIDKRNSDGTPIGVDDNVICIYKLESGAVGTMCASWSYYGKEDNSTIIYGKTGIMKIYSDSDYSIVIEKKNGDTVKYDLDKIQTNDNQTKSGIIDAFIESLENNTEVPVTGVQVLDAMKAVFASIESSHSGKTIEIE
ncbi:MAG: Gfo/Idh/MocA family oxidoreductase [Oscillospiraceae bacterium]|nr:Gfo/Idh/MocA family oxidoreductase [Oscillospiraceae bacterium]